MPPQTDEASACKMHGLDCYAMSAIVRSLLSEAFHHDEQEANEPHRSLGHHFSIMYLCTAIFLVNGIMINLKNTSNINLENSRFSNPGFLLDKYRDNLTF